MASAELNKVLELLKSQPRNPNATVAQMRAGMEARQRTRRARCDLRGFSHRRHRRGMDRSARGSLRPRHPLSPWRRIRDGLDRDASRDGCANRTRGESSRTGARVSARAGASVSRRGRRFRRRLQVAPRARIQAGQNRHRGRFCRRRSDAGDAARRFAMRSCRWRRRAWRFRRGRTWKAPAIRTRRARIAIRWSVAPTSADGETLHRQPGPEASAGVADPC